MAELLKKEVYSDYCVQINEMELSLLIAGLELLDIQDKKNPDKPDLTLAYYLLQDLREIKEK